LALSPGSVPGLPSGSDAPQWGRWLISDIYLDGAISEVATRRSEFAAILKNDGIDGLIAALNRKADILTATTAKAL
jgi:MlaC protein